LTHDAHAPNLWDPRLGSHDPTANADTSTVVSAGDPGHPISPSRRYQSRHKRCRSDLRHSHAQCEPLGFFVAGADIRGRGWREPVSWFNPPPRPSRSYSKYLCSIKSGRSTAFHQRGRRLVWSARTTLRCELRLLTRTTRLSSLASSAPGRDCVTSRRKDRASEPRRSHLAIPATSPI
jgi:hypothetical protein